MPLTPKQRAFVEAYSGNATEAAEMAGYSLKTAKAQGSRLLTNVDVLEAIKSREQRESRKRIASRQQRQEFWTEVMGDGKEDMRDRLKASELLGKSESDFTDRVEHSGGLELTVALPEVTV